MQKIAVFVVMSLVLVTGCAQHANNKKVENAHRHEAGAKHKQPSNKKVLNCVTKTGHHVYESKLACPLGGEDVVALRLGTHSTNGRYLDWEPVSYLRFPTPIPVCSNGFVIAKKEYSDEALEKLSAVVESEQYQALYKQKHATYFLYAKTLDFSGEKSPDEWWLYLNASWEADNCGDQTRYKEYALLVVAEAKAKLATLSPDQNDFWVLSTIIPNMYRRVGDFEQAAASLDKVGTPTLENKDSNEYFLLVKNLLADEIAKNNSEKVIIKER